MILRLLALVVLLLAGPAAQAHDELVSSTPADGETLAVAPASVVLTYSGDISDISPAVQVSDAAGAVVAEGAPAVDGITVTFPLPALSNGAYSVTWSVVSADGHRIEGTFGFTLAVPEPAPRGVALVFRSDIFPAAADVVPVRARLSRRASADADGVARAADDAPEQPGTSPTPWLIAAGGAVVVGIVAWAVRRRR